MNRHSSDEPRRCPSCNFWILVLHVVPPSAWTDVVINGRHLHIAISSHALVLLSAPRLRSGVVMQVFQRSKPTQLNSSVALLDHHALHALLHLRHALRVFQCRRQVAGLRHRHATLQTQCSHHSTAKQCCLTSWQLCGQPGLKFRWSACAQRAELRRPRRDKTQNLCAVPCCHTPHKGLHDDRSGGAPAWRGVRLYAPSTPSDSGTRRTQSPRSPTCTTGLQRATGVQHAGSDAVQ